MPRQSRRRKLAKYIYQDANGISGIVYLPGQPRVELRFPLKTPVAEIRRAMDLCAAQRRAMVPPDPAVGTLAEVVSTYLARRGTTLPERDEAGRLRAWVDACGAEPFATLTKGRLQMIVEGWLRAGYNAGTIAKRISSLRKVDRELADARDDDAPPHAIQRIKRPRPPRSGEIRGRPLDLVERVLANVIDRNPITGEPSKCKARLAAWAWTGQNPALLQQLRPEHINWTTTPPQLYLQPRRKGAGVDAGWIPLLPQAQVALREFFARDAAGVWNKGVVLRGFKAAVKKTQRQLRQAHRHQEAARLEGMTPKDLRHSIATALLQASPDVVGVQEYLRHADIKTTLQYTKGAASTRTHAVVAALAAATGFSKRKVPTCSPTVSPQLDAKIGGETRKLVTIRHQTPKPLTNAGSRS